MRGSGAALVADFRSGDWWFNRPLGWGGGYTSPTAGSPKRLLSLGLPQDVKKLPCQVLEVSCPVLIKQRGGAGGRLASSGSLPNSGDTCLCKGLAWGGKEKKNSGINICYRARRAVNN